MRISCTPSVISIARLILTSESTSKVWVLWQATMIGNKMYIFGGEDRSRRAVNDLFVLDMNSLAWEQPTSEGPSPSARSAHIACAVEDRFLVVFGGGSVARCFNDVWVLDTQGNKWNSLKPAGQVPSPRAGVASQYAAPLVVPLSDCLC